MLPENITKLIVKKHLGDLTQDEQIELEQWTYGIDSLKERLEEYDAYKKYSAKFYRKKQNALRGKSIRWRNFRPLLKYAGLFALPLIIAGLAFYYYLSRDSRVPILPGKEMAVINLSNGEVVKLDAKEAKVYKKDGREIYLPKIEVYDYIANIGDLDAANYSTISVPHGGFFNVTLADGTSIKLNSKSKMKFPFKFVGNQRKVWLEGEAYFDVAKDSIPFIVATETHDIRVLGTIFNVTSYPEDSSMTAALISGKIAVSNKLTGESEYLEAGECFKFNKFTNAAVKYTDEVQLYSLWTQGVFKFRNQSMEEIVKILKRWYRFDVEYDSDAIKNFRFTSIALKENPLDDVFRILQMTTSFKYSRRGNHFYLYE